MKKNAVFDKLEELKINGKIDAYGVSIEKVEEVYNKFIKNCSR